MLLRLLSFINALMLSELEEASEETANGALSLPLIDPDGTVHVPTSDKKA